MNDLTVPQTRRRASTPSFNGLGQGRPLREASWLGRLPRDDRGRSTGDPRDAGNIVLHAYEACDAVERSSYTIDGIAVSNFLTPSYFTEGNAPGTRNDFLGVGVDSFGVTKDSHIAFFDLNVGSWVTIVGAHVSAGRITAARAKMYSHPKAGRPSDEALLEDLRKYRRSLSAALKGEGATGLSRLRGITRASRYRQIGDALARKLGRIGKGKAQAAGRGGPSGKGR
jgi:hypothetical protein